MKRPLYVCFGFALLGCWLLASLLVACAGPDQLTSGAGTPTPFLGNLTPKGSGSVGLTATALATPGAASCSSAAVAAVSTQGWHVYKDRQYPLSLAVPPGWKAGGFAFSSADGTASYYEVALLPDTVNAPFDEKIYRLPEYMSLTLVLTKPEDWPVADFRPESQSVRVNHTMVKLYDRDQCESSNRTTGSLTLGQHQGRFYLQADHGHMQWDIAHFLGVLQSFAYQA